MSTERRNYIRSFRKRANLTQFELAYLLGSQTERRISAYERRQRNPDLLGALGLQVIFRVTQQELFPGMFAAVEAPILERAHILLEQTRNRSDRTELDRHKEDFLSALISQEEAHERTELWENKKNLRFYLP